jgi:hypothetical protein
MNELIEIIKGRWLTEGMEIAPGVNCEQVESFEKRFKVSLPRDMRVFYQSINGMGRSDVWDENLITICDLVSVVPWGTCSPVGRRSLNSGYSDCFIVGGHSFGLPHFCVRLGDKDNSVLTLYNNGESKNVCRTFRRFLSLYVADELELFY